VKLNDLSKPLSEEERQELARLSRYPAGKMNSGDLSTYATLCTRNEDWARQHYLTWLNEDEDVQRCLALDAEEMRRDLATVESLAQFDADARLSSHPSQEELQKSIRLSHNKLLGLTYSLIHYEAVYTRLKSLLDDAQDYWSSLITHTKQSEWQAKGGYYSFDVIRRLLRLRDKASEVRQAAKLLQDLLTQGHAMQSRLVEVRRQQLELGE